MKHRYSLEGYGYRLRPVRFSDAQFIIDTRHENEERNRYIHPTPLVLADQQDWLRRYMERDGDYYFVVEDRLDGTPQGLISFYDVEGDRAEWGRWVIREGSLAAAESVLLIYRIAFEQAGLKELFCRTVQDNVRVVSFHTSIGEKTRCIIPDAYQLPSGLYNAVEQYAEKDYFYAAVAPLLERQAKMIFRRNLAVAMGGFSFHHLGVATRSIDKELPIYTLLGYEKEGEPFTDPGQGIRGQFLTGKSGPRLELLENLPGSTTLDLPLEKGQKIYHMAFLVPDIEKAITVLTNCRAKVISPPKASVYFGGRICFLLLPNMGMLELLEGTP